MARYNPLNACGGTGSMSCAPLQILVTNGAPEGAPDPNVYLPIAYDAADGCFYLWQENTGWFEGTGIAFEYDAETQVLTIEHCDQVLEIPVGGGGDTPTEGLVADLSFDPDTLELTLTFVDEDQDPIVVDLSALASDFYADSVTFDADTRTLTITRTGDLPDLTTEIPAGGDSLPEGTEFDVLRYGEDGEPEAGRIDLRHMVPAELIPAFTPYALYAPVFAYTEEGELGASSAFTVDAAPAISRIPIFATHTSGGVDSYVLQTQSIARNLWFDATTVVAPMRQMAPVSVEMFRDAIRPFYAAVEAIDPIADPTAATVEDVAAKVNEVIATLKALLP